MLGCSSEAESQKHMNIEHMKNKSGTVAGK